MDDKLDMIFLTTEESVRWYDENDNEFRWWERAREEHGKSSKEGTEYTAHRVNRHTYLEINCEYHCSATIMPIKTYLEEYPNRALPEIGKPVVWFVEGR